MANYATKQDIENRLGIIFNSNTIPTSDELAGMLADADGFINKEAVVETNMEDTYGDLRNIAIDLVLKMISNMWYFRNPELFPYVDIELTPEQKRDIHKTHKKFVGLSWELGG